METFKLSGADLEAMKAFYQEELSKTINRLQHLKTVLSQLGGSNIEINISGSSEGISTSGASASSASTQTEVEETQKSGKKRGPKSIWGSFILKRLQQLDRPLTYNELVDEAMVFFKLNESKRQTVINAINNSAFRLRKNSNRVDTFSSGGREKFVALKSWFEEPGKIKKEYEKKIVKPPRKTRKTSGAPRKTGAVGRPRKVNQE